MLRDFHVPENLIKISNLIFLCAAKNIQKNYISYHRKTKFNYKHDYGINTRVLLFCNFRKKKSNGKQ